MDSGVSGACSVSSPAKGGPEWPTESLMVVQRLSLTAKTIAHILGSGFEYIPFQWMLGKRPARLKVKVKAFSAYAGNRGRARLQVQYSQIQPIGAFQHQSAVFSGEGSGQVILGVNDKQI